MRGRPVVADAGLDDQRDGFLDAGEVHLELNAMIEEMVRARR